MARHKGPKLTPYERLMLRTEKHENGCWLWLGAKNNAGFGMIKSEDPLKMVTVHRVMAEHLGWNIKNVEVQHTCTNYHCVNPDHLVLGNKVDRYITLYQRHESPLKKLWKDPYRTCPHCGGVSTFNKIHIKHSNCGSIPHA